MFEYIGFPRHMKPYGRRMKKMFTAYEQKEFYKETGSGSGARKRPSGIDETSRYMIHKTPKLSLLNEVV